MSTCFSTLEPPTTFCRMPTAPRWGQPLHAPGPGPHARSTSLPPRATARRIFGTPTKRKHSAAALKHDCLRASATRSSNCFQRLAVPRKPALRQCSAHPPPTLIPLQHTWVSLSAATPTVLHVCNPCPFNKVKHTLFSSMHWHLGFLWFTVPPTSEDQPVAAPVEHVCAV